MVTLEKLKAMRAKEGEALKKLQGRLAEKRQKKKIKADIRKIKGAKLRAYTGMDRDAMDRFGNAFKATGKTLKSVGSTLGKGLLGAGEAAEKYYGRPRRRR